MNYQKEMEKIIQSNIEKEYVPTLLLHSCCAPCSSYVLESLSDYFKITVLYYNPNIFPEKEYEYRIEEQEKLISKLPVKNPIRLIAKEYTPQDFYKIAKGLENEKEGGERCFRCYRLRLEEAAREAKKGNFDYFTTTLSISPLKNAEKLNQIGIELAQQYGIPYLLSDFKKKNGYKRSVELSKIYELYRQNYCGCIFSAKQTSNIQKTVI